MDAFATAESVLHENEASQARAEPHEPSQPDAETREENKFQRAISSWRSMYIHSKGFGELNFLIGK